MRLALLLASALLAGSAPKQNLSEYLTAQLEADKGFEPAERQAIIAAMNKRFAGYSNDVVSPGKTQAADVALSMVIEGHFDQAPADRIAEVSFAAYQAVRRGAEPEVVEGIGLYGYQKPVPADRLSTWANGYRQLSDAKVPGDVGADLVRNAMKSGWDDASFNHLKWALTKASKDKRDVRAFATYLFGHMEQGAKAGALAAQAESYFRKLKPGQKPILPKYQGVFDAIERPSETAAKMAKEAAAEAARKAVAKSGNKVLGDFAKIMLPKGTSLPKSSPKSSPRPEPAPRQYTGSFGKLWPGLDKSARSYLGVPYVWGGETRQGIDCSAFTRNSYRENEVGLPRVSRQQWETGKVVTDLREGDLVFFNTRGVGVSHVGMYISKEGNRFIHASSSRGVVIDDLGKNYYKQRYLGARRVVP
jgi:cell wall-associated NlpC family hydrolase